MTRLSQQVISITEIWQINILKILLNILNYIYANKQLPGSYISMVTLLPILKSFTQTSHRVLTNKQYIVLNLWHLHNFAAQFHLPHEYTHYRAPDLEKLLLIPRQISRCVHVVETSLEQSCCLQRCVMPECSEELQLVKMY